MKLWPWVVGAFLILAPGCVVDAPPADPVAAVERGLRSAVTFEGEPGWTLEERMEHYGVPGVGIAVIHDYRVAWFKTYGLADRETGEPVTADTLFQAGSVSKPVAALGALTMVQDGLLTLDGDINDRLTSWKLPQNEFTAQRKVHLTHLLSHTGGLTVHGFPGYAVDDPVPTLVEVLDGSGPANTAPIRVDREPGAGWRYSGGGYTVAQQMMIDVAGQPFPELMDQRVLAPLGMSKSTFLQPLPPDRLQQAAAGYLPDNSPVEGKRHTYPEMAAAGLWTTAEDLARLAIEVQLALRGEGRVLSRELAEKMLEPVDEGYGRGFGLSRADGEPYFSHGGWDEGFCAHLVAHRDDGYGVAVMINSNHPDLQQEIVRAVALEYGWGGYGVRDKLEMPEVALERYPGRYRYNAELGFSIERDGERLLMRYTGQEPKELFYVGDERYLRRERSTPITFTEEDGDVVFHFVTGDDRQSHERLAENERLPRELLAEGGYDAALPAYRALLEASPEEQAVSEGYLNSQGLSLLRDGHVETAIDLLRIVTVLYPDSANTWDSVGLAYRKAGDLENAVRYYARALEIDPEFPSAVEAMRELQGE